MNWSFKTKIINLLYQRLGQMNYSFKIFSLTENSKALPFPFLFLLMSNSTLLNLHILPASLSSLFQNYSSKIPNNALTNITTWFIMVNPYFTTLNLPIYFQLLMSYIEQVVQQLPKQSEQGCCGSCVINIPKHKWYALLYHSTRTMSLC